MAATRSFRSRPFTNPLSVAIWSSISCAEIRGYTPKSCGRYPSLRRTSSFCRNTSMSPKQMTPLSGSCRVASVRIRRFTRAIGTQQPVHALGNAQRDIIQRLHAVRICHGKMRDFDVHCHSTTTNGANRRFQRISRTYSPKICLVRSSCCFGRCSSQIPRTSATVTSVSTAIEMPSQPRCQKTNRSVTSVRSSHPYRCRGRCKPRRTRTSDRPRKCAKNTHSTPRIHRRKATGIGMSSMWRTREGFATGSAG
jgi:hypothetical protein